jgi:SAM-dependent methyltransferase
MNSRFKFYRYNILKFLDKNSKILIVGAGIDDFRLFEENNFTNFTCSNFGGKEINGKNFKQIDINDINELDESFDYVVAHACIHHCSRPHNGILEMYRVSKKGILVIESKDSLMMRIMTKLKLAEEYEVSAINNPDSFGDQGGVDNSNIPNFVYRWTEVEIKKLINSYDPRYKYKIDFEYEFEFSNLLEKIKNKILQRILKFLFPIIVLFLKIVIKKQANLFSFFINKQKSKETKHSWIK